MSHSIAFIYDSFIKILSTKTLLHLQVITFRYNGLILNSASLIATRFCRQIRGYFAKYHYAWPQFDASGYENNCSCKLMVVGTTVTKVAKNGVKPRSLKFINKTRSWRNHHPFLICFLFSIFQQPRIQTAILITKLFLNIEVKKNAPESLHYVQTLKCEIFWCFWVFVYLFEFKFSKETTFWDNMADNAS